MVPKSSNKCIMMFFNDFNIEKPVDLGPKVLWPIIFPAPNIYFTCTLHPWENFVNSRKC